MNLAVHGTTLGQTLKNGSFVETVLWTRNRFAGFVWRLWLARRIWWFLINDSNRFYTTFFVFFDIKYFDLVGLLDLMPSEVLMRFESVVALATVFQNIIFFAVEIKKHIGILLFWLEVRSRVLHNEIAIFDDFPGRLESPTIFIHDIFLLSGDFSQLTFARSTLAWCSHCVLDCP